MPKLVNGAASITIAKKSGTVLTLLTDDTYCDSDNQFTIGVQEGVGAANTASADVSVDSTAGSAGGTNISGVIGNKSATEPTSGYFIRMEASGSGSSKITTAGWMDAGDLATASASATKYFPVDAGTVTQNAPTIDSATGVVTATVSTTAGYVPTAASADSNTLQLTTQAAQTINTSSSDQTIAAGQYLTGAQTIKAVTTENISAANIKAGVTVKVGDSNDDDRIAGMTGTFTDASTVTSGQTAATAAQIVSGYSAWVDGAEVQGSIAAKTASDVTVSGDTVTIPAGTYAAQVQKTVSAGSVTQNAPTVDTTTGLVTATSTVVAGYVDASTETNTLQLTTQAAATITPTRSTQTAVAAGKYTLGAVEVGPIPNNYYLLTEVFPVDSLYANTTGTNPSVTLGFGTWTLIRSIPYRWLDVDSGTWGYVNESNEDWSFADKIVDNIYVFKRDA